MADEQEPTQLDMSGDPTPQPQVKRGRPRREDKQPGMKAGEFVGRDGEILTRTRTGGADPFDIPLEIVPKGWSYQWNTVTVFNNSDVVMGQSMTMYANGWRPVPAERHPGVFVPFGTKGAIIREGMRLEERPAEMTKQAAKEDERAARRQMSDRDESLMGRRANLAGNMKSGFEMGGKYRGTGAKQTRMSIEPEPEAPAPSYPLAEPGE